MPDELRGEAAAPSLDEAPCGVLTFDESGRIRYANATAAGMLGRTADDLAGRPLDELLPAAGRIFYSTHLFPLLRMQGRAEELYMPMLGPSGAQLPMLVNGRSRQVGDSLLFDLVVVPMRQRNVLESELISARNAAQEASGAKDRFVSVVSHELRSPLAAVTGYADLLLRERVGTLNERQRAYVEHIRNSAADQAQLINDILDFAAAGEERTLAVMRVPLEELLARIEAILDLRAREDGRRLERPPVAADLAVLADPNAVQRILLNLGTNAVKYSAEGSVVHIAAAADAGRVRIQVTDEGTGIPSDQLERIFDPFVRLANSPGGSRRGVGLGLAISRDLARAMGGDVTVASQVGIGSTFTLELPIA